MRKGSDLIGKPVVSFDSGEQFETIQDLIFDQTSNQLLGFVVDEGGWFSGARVLPLNRVQALGQDAVIVPDKKAVIPADTDPVMSRILERNNILKGTKIVTTDGKDLGKLVDLYFDDETGAVEGYEASGGLFADAYTGRSFVPAPHTLKIGEDVAFVPPETATMMEEQVGGLKAAAQQAGDQLSTASQSAGAALTNAAVSPEDQKRWAIGRTAERDVVGPDNTLLVAAGQPVTQLAVDEAERQGVLPDLYRATGGSVTAGLQGTVDSQAVDQALGRRVNEVVRTDQGLIIAAPGQIVTEQVINRARTYHKETELMSAVGLTTGGAVKQAAANTTEAVKEGAQNIKEGAASLLDRLSTKLSETKDRAQREAEEARVKNALGRPVTRVILDEQDNVILNVGELITHAAVERAAQANALDMLLSSVYDKDPELAPEELRAPEPGAASLEQQHGNQSS